MSNIKVTEVAKSVPFDNSVNGFTSTDVQSAIEEAKTSSSGLIPEYVTDPVSPVPGQMWVKVDETIQGTPIGMLLTLTRETVLVSGYRLSYKTIEGTIVRTSLV